MCSQSITTTNNVGQNGFRDEGIKKSLAEKFQQIPILNLDKMWSVL